MVTLCARAVVSRDLVSESEASRHSVAVMARWGEVLVVVGSFTWLSEL